MSPDALLILVAACLAVNVSPGPSIVLVSSVSAARGFRAAALTVAGMQLGAFVHVLLAASGLAALLAASPLTFGVVQYLGAGYLIYLGVDLLRNRRDADTATLAVSDSIDWHYLRRGFLVDALNPKIALFFLAFIPPFLGLFDKPGFIVSIALGSVFLVTGALVNLTLAAIVASGSRRLRGRAAELLQRWLPGSLLILLGARLLWQAR